MSIWGRQDSESPAGEHQSQAEAHDARQPDTDHQAGEPAPAFWRTQGQTQAPHARDPADAPVPVLTGVVIDAETPVEAGEPVLAEEQEPVLAEEQEPASAETQEPAGAEAQEPAAAAQDPAAAPEPAAAAPEPADATTAAQRWREILVAFVDDPRGSVKMASGAVDEAIDEFVNSVRDRQRALASSWQSTGTGTEQLRVAVRDYRALWHQVRQLDLGEKTGG